MENLREGSEATLKRGNVETGKVPPPKNEMISEVIKRWGLDRDTPFIQEEADDLENRIISQLHALGFIKKEDAVKYVEIDVGALFAGFTELPKGVKSTLWIEDLRAFSENIKQSNPLKLKQQGEGKK